MEKHREIPQEEIVKDETLKVIENIENNLDYDGIEEVKDEKTKLKGIKNPKLRRLVTGVTAGVMLLAGTELGLAKEKEPEVKGKETPELIEKERQEKFDDLEKLAKKFNIKLIKYSVDQENGFKIFYDGQEIGSFFTDQGTEDEFKINLKNILVENGAFKKELKKQANEAMEKLAKNDPTGYTYSYLGDDEKNLGYAHFRYQILDKDGKEAAVLHLLGDEKGLIHSVEKREFELKNNPEVEQIMKKFKMRMEGERLYLDLDPANEIIYLNEDGKTKEISFTVVNETTIELTCVNSDDSKTIVTITNGMITSIK
jgi:hypothetical protein